LVGRLHADRSGLPVTASGGPPSRATTSSRPSPATCCGSAVTQRERPHGAPWAASGKPATALPDRWIQVQKWAAQ